MWMDDNHTNYVCCETMEELEEHCGPLFLYHKDNERWMKMWSLILKCTEMFGFLNISLYKNDYMKYGDGIEEFLSGFWINLKEADYTDDDSSVDFGKAHIFIENGYMWVSQ